MESPPFAKGKWTHIVYTWESFNTGRADGVARLYLDGAPRGDARARGSRRSRGIRMRKAIALGLNYIGLFDEVAIFNRALSEEEVRTVHTLKTGVGEVYVAK